MEKITLDLSGLGTKEEFHDYIREVLDFPDYYGKNKDAFWDCLTEYYYDEEIEIVGLGALGTEMKEFANEYVALMNEYEKECSGNFEVTISH